MTGLLPVPGIAQGPQAATAQIGSGNQRVGSRLYARGMIFGGTASGGFPRLLRWRNPYLVSAVDEFDSVENFFNDVSAFAYSAATNKVYAGGSLLNGGTGGNEVSITQVDPDVFSADAEVVAQVALGNLDSSVVSTISGGLACDGTFLYYLLCNTDQNAWVGKFALADGSLAAQFQIPNPTSGTARGGTVLIYDGAGSLYAAGGTTNLWAAKIPTALGSATVLNLGGTATTAPPLAFLDASGFWIGDNTTSPRVAYKVALNLLGSTAITPSRPGLMAGLCEAVDPSFFWILQGGTGEPAAMTLCDKATLTPRRVVEGPPARAQFPAWMVPLDRANVWLSQAGGQSTKPFATLTPTWADPSVTPLPPGGRGAGW